MPSTTRSKEALDSLFDTIEQHVVQPHWEKSMRDFTRQNLKAFKAGVGIAMDNGINFWDHLRIVKSICESLDEFRRPPQEENDDNR